MDARDLFLQQHSIVHSAAVGGNKGSAVERNLAGLSDEQMRVRPLRRRPLVASHCDRVDHAVPL